MNLMRLFLLIPVLLFGLSSSANTQWYSQTSGTTVWLYGVSFTDANNGTAVGYFGTILRTTNGGVTFIEEEEEIDEVPTDFLLSQNYPNPFNPITNINYTLLTESQVKLSVYNILGELVKTIISENQNAGKYDAVWNAANYPSGVYIYTLDAVSVSGNKQTKTSRKMLLMK